MSSVKASISIAPTTAPEPKRRRGGWSLISSIGGGALLPPIAIGEIDPTSAGGAIVEVRAGVNVTAWI